MENRSDILFQIKSILIVCFIKEFTKLEKLVMRIFQQEIIKVDHQIKNALYFYYGLYIAHDIRYDFENNKVSLAHNSKYDENEVFKSLNMIKIIRFEKKKKLISAFNINIESFIRKTTSFTFYDCCEKLIKMRNILAHEVDNLSFKNSDIIELLPLEVLSNYEYDYTKNCDIKNIDSTLQALFSNIIYMRTIMEHLDKTEDATTLQ